MKPLIRICRMGLSILIFALMVASWLFEWMAGRVTRAQMFLTRALE